MRLGTLVEDAHGLPVDHREAGIAPADAFVQEALPRPGLSPVQAQLDGDVLAVVRVRGIGEQEDVLLQGVLGGADLQQAGHADGLHELAVRHVRGPGAAHILGDIHGAAGLAVVPHVEHQLAGGDFGHLGLRGVDFRVFMDMPGEAAVRGVHDAGGRGALRFRLLMLERDDQGAVVHRDAASGALEGEVPGLLLDLPREVHGLGPGEAVVGGADHHKLGRGFGLEAAAGRPPGGLAGFPAVRPGREDEQVPGHFVHEDARVAYAVHILRQAAPFAHVDGDDHRPPGAAAVRGAAHAHVHVPLQVAGILVPDIVHAHERTLFRGHQAGNPVGGDAVVTGGAHLAGEPVLAGAVFLDGKAFRLDFQGERLADIFHAGSVQVDIQDAVPDFPGAEGLAAQSAERDFENRLRPFRDRDGRHRDVLVLDDGNLAVMDLDGGRGDERDKLGQ